MKTEDYDVIKTEFENGNIELIISRKDGKPIRNWYALQNLKNVHIGEDKFAIEVFPPEDDLVDYANKYHLFYIKGFDFPNTNKGNYIVGNKTKQESFS